MRMPLVLSTALWSGCSSATILPGDAPGDGGTRGHDVVEDSPQEDDPRAVVVLSARHVGVADFDGISQRDGDAVIFVGGSNTARRTLDRDPSDGVTGFGPAQELLPRDVSGCPGFFGASPYLVNAWITLGDTAVAFFSKACSRGGIGNDVRGVGIARWVDTARALTLRSDGALQGDPELLFGAHAFRPSTGLLRTGEGATATLYAWDCDDFHDLTFWCHLGRAPVAHVTDAAAWRYRSGAGWSSEGPGDVQFRSAGNILTVTWNTALGRYLMITGGWGANAVYFRTATAPEGPWSDERMLFATQAPVVDGLWAILAHHHAAWDRADGTIYVTYQTTTDHGHTVTIPVVQARLGLR